MSYGLQRLGIGVPNSSGRGGAVFGWSATLPLSSQSPVLPVIRPRCRSKRHRTKLSHPQVGLQLRAPCHRAPGYSRVIHQFLSLLHGISIYW